MHRRLQPGFQIRVGRRSGTSERKKPLLKEEQFQELKEQLKKRPPDGGLWTRPKVARWIEKITGIEKVWNQRG